MYRATRCLAVTPRPDSRCGVRVSARPLVFAIAIAVSLGAGCSAGQTQATPTSVCPSSAAVKPAAAASLDELIARSDWIVIGNVERVLPSRVPADISHPITEFDLHFREILKGQMTGADVRVRQYGGTIRGCEVQIFGYVPRPGDYGAYFLTDARYPDGVLALTTPDQGAYVLDALGRDRFVFSSPDGASEAFSLAQLRSRLNQP